MQGAVHLLCTPNYFGGVNLSVCLVLLELEADDLSIATSTMGLGSARERLICAVPGLGDT